MRTSFLRARNMVDDLGHRLSFNYYLLFSPLFFGTERHTRKKDKFPSSHTSRELTAGLLTNCVVDIVTRGTLRSFSVVAVSFFLGVAPGTCHLDCRFFSIPGTESRTLLSVDLRHLTDLEFRPRKKPTTIRMPLNERSVRYSHWSATSGER